MKKLIAVLMVASFAGAALPAVAQNTTPAPAASTPAASDKPAKSEKKHHSKKHSKDSKSKETPKS